MQRKYCLQLLFAALLLFCVTSFFGGEIISTNESHVMRSVSRILNASSRVAFPPMKNSMYSSFEKNRNITRVKLAQESLGSPTKITKPVPERSTHPPPAKSARPVPAKSLSLVPSKSTLPTASAEHKCNKTSNFVFIKTHKTGSSTLRSLTCRFGYFRNLSFVLGVGGIIGHLNGVPIKFGKNTSNLLPPIGVRKGDFANYRNYNISNIHLIYNKASVKKIMYPGSDLKFFTVLREPSEQWLSSFQYFKQYVNVGLKLENLSETLLPYLHKLKWGQGNFNRQLRDLGVSSKVIFGTPKVLNETIKQLDKDLAFVLIMEYFDESLILLKKVFCWSFEDILYVKKRQQPNPLRVSEDGRKEILRLSAGDVALYNHFLGVFWQRVEEYGPSFQEDLKTFRRLLNDTWDECIGKSVAQISHDRYLYVENHLAQNSSTFCWALVNSKFAMDVEIVRRQGKLSDKRWKELL